ncbi:MAG TPA: 6,7-dimethyl-8-ribityllumazine synthase [Chitinophagaceae bacterium]|nr:6,7-dimethyl-8-ribityllumazine synthase [Chitinophagaceae bacterium]HNF71830.1 6,7-dimethyl-8-ribityllumazine synthase [Chitinophagaceae bacterium]
MATPSVLSGLYNYSNLRLPLSQVVLVYTEWNEIIVSKLREGAKKILSTCQEISIQELMVPGAVEIPFAIRQHYRHKPATAYIALGCVIRGETPHFDYVCDSVVQGVTYLNTTLDAPVIFGVLTVNSNEEAYERLGGVHGHKGEEAAIAALKMIALKHDIFNAS